MSSSDSIQPSGTTITFRDGVRGRLCARGAGRGHFRPGLQRCSFPSIVAWSDRQTITSAALKNAPAVDSQHSLYRQWIWSGLDRQQVLAIVLRQRTPRVPRMEVTFILSTWRFLFCNEISLQTLSTTKLSTRMHWRTSVMCAAWEKCSGCKYRSSSCRGKKTERWKGQCRKCNFKPKSCKWARQNELGEANIYGCLSLPYVCEVSRALRTLSARCSAKSKDLCSLHDIEKQRWAWKHQNALHNDLVVSSGTTNLRSDCTLHGGLEGFLSRRFLRMRNFWRLWFCNCSGVCLDWNVFLGKRSSCMCRHKALSRKLRTEQGQFVSGELSSQKC